jgi:hypothetical protein
MSGAGSGLPLMMRMVGGNSGATCIGDLGVDVPILNDVLGILSPGG